MASVMAIRGGGGGAKVKPPGAGGGGKGRSTEIMPEGKKKVEESGRQIVSFKPKSATVVSKPEVKGKAVMKTVTKTLNSKTTTVKVKAVKKVYTLPGQKHDPPEEREPLRIFYESLSKQIPSSEMAEVWLMEHGMLSPERAKKAYERKQRRQQQQRTGTPIKSLKLERPESSKKPQPISKNGDTRAKKRVQYSDDDDDDFIVKHKKSRA